MARLISEALSDIELEEVETMIAIQYTNSFEINATGLEGRAIYPIISKINHSCIPNVAHCNTIFGENTTYHLNGSGEDVKGKQKCAQSLFATVVKLKSMRKLFSKSLISLLSNGIQKTILGQNCWSDGAFLSQEA